MLTWDDWAERLIPDGGGFTTGEGKRLYEIARDLPSNSTAVEIGVYRGYSALVMLAGNPTLHVWGVDFWGLYAGGVSMLDDMALCLRRAGTEFLNRLHPLRMSSEQAARVWPSANLSLVHIDATHTHADVMHDTDTWVRHALPGAAFVFHDYDPERFPGVVRAVDDLRSQPRFVEFSLTRTLAMLRYAPCE